MPNVTYRRSTADDAATVFDLVSRSVARLAPTPYSQAVVDTWMTGRAVEDYRADCAGQHLWIAARNGTPVGFAHGVPGEIMRLFVDAGHAGLGIGKGLMQRALMDALPDTSGDVYIDATLNAVPFYQQWGFSVIGTGVFPGRDATLPPIEIAKLHKLFPR